MTVKIDYTGITCIPPTPEYERIRFVLRKEGNNPLFVIGLNSSTADEYDYDPTVGKAMRIAYANGWKDGFVMLNLYPLRKTDPQELPQTADQKLLVENIAAIQKELGKVSKPTILAAWGANIKKRKYLGDSLQKIVRLTAAQGAIWKHFGDLTKDVHPRHLLYVKSDAKLSKFDIEKYIKTLSKR